MTIFMGAQSFFIRKIRSFFEKSEYNKYAFRTSGPLAQYLTKVVALRIYLHKKKKKRKKLNICWSCLYGILLRPWQFPPLSVCSVRAFIIWLIHFLSVKSIRQRRLL